MTEEEAFKELRKIRLEYMMLPPKERLARYEEYQKRLANVRHQIIKMRIEQVEKGLKKK